MIKNAFFGPVPKSHTQMGSLSAKNANEKFSRLGTFKYSLFMFLVVLVGAPSLKCLSSERWSDLIPSCDKIECSDISTVVKVGNQLDINKVEDG